VATWNIRSHYGSPEDIAINNQNNKRSPELDQDIQNKCTSPDTDEIIEICSGNHLANTSCHKCFKIKQLNKVSRT